MTKYHLLSGLLLLSLAACGGAKSNNAAGNAQGNAAAQTNVATPAANDAVATEVGHNQDGPRILLTGDGVLADGTDASLVRFGAPRTETMAAVSRTLGRERALNAVDECGGSGRAQQADYGVLVLFFQEDKFVGWEQRERSENPYVGTPGGVNVGSRRPDLAAALGGAPNVEQSSLGTEFDRGGVSGLLASDRPDAQVDRLWAGNNCAMR
jgi:hypothetical protein